MTRAGTTDTAWMPRPSTLAGPGTGEVHVWRAQLSGPHRSDWDATLAGDEQERADRFRVAEDRRRFVMTRALLRIILGDYLNRAPESVRFSYTEFGKPSLGDIPNPGGITFNVAHSGDCSLLAFGSRTDLGIDVEHLKIERNVVELAKAVLPPAQYEQLLARPDDVRKREFLQAWTRREAVGKALGVGIDIPTHEIDSAGESGADWSIHDIDVAGDYVAALAARARDVRVRLWTYASR